MSKINFQKTLLLEIKAFFSPLIENMGDVDAMNAFFYTLGYDMQTLLGSNTTQFNSSINSLNIEVNKVENLANGNLDSILDSINAFKGIITIPSKVSAISSSFGSNSSHVSDLPIKTIERLLLIYIYSKNPAVYEFLKLCTIIYVEQPNPYVVNIDGTNRIVKGFLPQERIDIGRLGSLLSNPKQTFSQEYWPNGIPNDTEASKVGRKLFIRIAKMLNYLGVHANVGLDMDMTGFTPYTAEKLKSVLVISKVFNLHEDISSHVGLIANIISANDSGPGLFMQPYGSLTISEEIAKWIFALNITAATSGFKITDSGITFYDTSNSQFKFKLTSDSITSPDSPLYRVGSDKGTRFELDRMGFEAFLDLQPPDKLYGIMMKLHQMKFVLKGGDGDGFMSKILGNGIDAKFDFGIGWNNKDGVHFAGGGGFEKYYATNKKIGPIEFQGLRIGMGVVVGSGQPTKIPIYAGADILAKFKGLDLRIDGVGLKLELSFPPNGTGNFGLFNANFGFKPPQGIGIKIKASRVEGEGYLYLNDGEYIGAISLKLALKTKTIEINAVGILTTKLPSGDAGYSFIIVAGVTGLNIPLGMGFTLGGIGGMLGLHRTMDKDAIREGLRVGRLDSILFPNNILNNIHKIASDIQELFPIKSKQFLVAPMAQITWPNKPLVYGNVGLVIESGNSFHIGILGRVYAILPNEESDLVNIKVAFFGYLNFDNEEFYFDASIYNSHIAMFSIEGDIAVRIFWGQQKEFLLSVGGFHPEFRPTANLKVNQLKKIRIALLTNNPSLIIQAYFAITSNTIQFGANADFYFNAYVCEVKGGLSFDALIQYSPFHFTIGIHGYVGIYVLGGCLFSIELRIRFSGPAPFIIYCKATIEICFFISAPVHFDITFGENAPPPLPSVSISPKLIEELNSIGNWVTLLPATKKQYVRLRTSKSKVLIDPMGRIQISQKVVPLDVNDVKKYGNNSALDGSKGYRITSVKVANSDLKTEKCYDSFSPAHYFEYNEDDKLKLRSYEKYASGVIAGNSDIKMGKSMQVDTQYEYTVIDTEVADNANNTQNSFTTNIPVKKFLAGNAVGQSSIYRDYELSNINIGNVSLRQTNYIISHITSMGSYNGVTYESQGLAISAMNALILADPNLEGRLKIIEQ